MHDDDMNQHPVDRLITELIQAGRAATRQDIEQIIERMATAPFSSRVVTVPMDERGATYDEIVLGARAESLHYHLC